MASPKFNHTSRSNLKEQFFNRIGDNSRSFWTDDEINKLIDEALLTFGAIAQSWKEEVEIKINEDQTFYDITSNLFANQDLLSFNLDYQWLLDRLNIHLIETISEANPISSITSLSEILKFARNRINQFQFLTGLVLTKGNFDLPSPPINKLTVPDNLIDIIRATYYEQVDANNVDPILYYKLREEDEQSLAYQYRDAFLTTIRIPKYYTTLLGNLNQVWIYPPPNNLGALEIISVNGVSPSEIINLNTKINLPNNLVPYIKWGVLADIFLKDGIGNDLLRGAYCLGRWNEGIQIGLNYSSILNAYLNGVPIPLDAISNIDDEDSGWQNRIGKPSLIGIAGYNILAPNRIPIIGSSTVYSLSMFSITNAYLPISDDDFIDIKLEYIEPLLNYLCHLAFIKDGATTIKESENMKNDFIKTAISHNLRLLERGISFQSLMMKSKLQKEDEPTEVKEQQNQQAA